MTPAVTVLVPCHDQGEFVLEAVESALTSTFAPLEVIVVDDGSTDPQTLTVLDHLVCPRTTVVHQARRGLGEARNTGARLARGRYLLPLDADDTVEPTFVEKAYRLLEDDPGVAWIYTHVRFFGDADFVCRMEPFNFYHLLWDNLCCACALMRRRAFEDAGGYTTMEGYEDWDLWIALAKRGWCGRLLPEVLFNYRRHGETMGLRARARHAALFAEIRRRHADLYEDAARLREIRRRWCRHPLLSEAFVRTRMASRASWFPGWLRAALVALRETTPLRRNIAGGLG